MRVKAHPVNRPYRPGERVRLKLTFEKPIEKFSSVSVLLGGPMHGERRSEITLKFETPAYSATNGYIVTGTIPVDIERGRYRPIAVYVQQNGEFEQTVSHPDGDGSFFIDVGDPTAAVLPELLRIEPI